MSVHTTLSNGRIEDGNYAVDLFTDPVVVARRKIYQGAIVDVLHHLGHQTRDYDEIMGGKKV